MVCLKCLAASHTGQMNGVQYSHTAVLHIFILLWFMPRKANVIISPLKQSVDLENSAKNSSIKCSNDTGE